MVTMELYSDWGLEVELHELEKVLTEEEEVAMVLGAFPSGASWEVSFCFATSLHDSF